ncbi:aldehyde dehydrogenase [Bosea sp. MMO-172]|uniref:aldehyde dehydrogenase n=1 Tax=Bosea sp. MMO-172 TaxID=3127885 RepID=UPI003018B430
MIWDGPQDRIFVAGEWARPQSGDGVDVISPFSEKPIGRAVSASRTDIDSAVAAARAALDSGPWPRMQLAERMAILQRLSELLKVEQDRIARLVTAEMGCPITLSQGMQAAGPRVLLDSFLELAPRYPFTELRRSSTGNGLVIREPVGVVAAVIPWNAPMLIAMIKLAPALLAGNTVVLKPALETPFDSYLLAELAQKAGLPKGVLNVVPADREVSEYLCLHPGVNKVSFTGSSAAGRKLASLCGQEIRRITLELGGKSAAIVLDDADIPTVVEFLRLNSLRNSGQVCSNKTRILVSRRRRDAFLDAYAAMVGAMPVGDPADAATQIGPLVSSRQRERVEGYIARGKAEGARVVAGGGRPRGLDSGWFVEPTVFADVEPDATIAQEEIFGPVVSVLTYGDEDEAVTIANNSIYGLNGSVFGADVERAVGLARRIRTGTVEINGSGVGFHSPIGGFKQSGIGREAGLEGFDAYVELKSIGLPPAYADALSQSLPASG